MISQKGFHVYWEKTNVKDNEFIYFQVPSDLIFDPFENLSCVYNGQIELELPKEAVHHSLDVWCPGSIGKIHFVCRYQNEIGKCRIFHPVVSKFKIVPSAQPSFELVSIPFKSQSDQDFVIYGTFLYFLFVSAVLVRKLP